MFDKADETQLTGSSAEATARLLHPLLASTRLLETDGVSWLFFLWSRVREHYGAGEMPVRLDKIANAEIAWDASFLAEMVSSRLLFYSDKKVGSLGDLLAPDIDPVKTSEVFVALSMQSPRELIRILDAVFREHDESGGSRATEPLTLISVERGLDKYCREHAENAYDPLVVQRLLRLGKTEFTNRDVQAAFKINQQSARGKLVAWKDAGIVAQIGTRPSGEAGGKPAYEFGIVDRRMQRVVSKQLVSISALDAALEGSIEVPLDVLTDREEFNQEE